jgi:eukaryotic-like serine/threonine-protein kinase
MTEPAIQQTVIGDHNIFTATGDVHIVYQLPPAEAEDRRNLLILLNKVKKFWVEGVLEQSVYHEALIQLGKESRPEIVEHPWERVLELPEARRPLPSEKGIREIFDETGRTLLIVGEPGSGKTVTLLELARALITRALQDPTQPIPLVFNLSTWAEKRQPILDWLASELSTKYQIPDRFGRPWLENHRLLPLLDGLDEVDPKYRASCVAAINEFIERIGLPGLAVCSRLREYLALPQYLKLSGAVCLQPLTPSRIENYLCKAGPRLASLSTALHDDPVLQELAESPLMLSIMTMAYQDLPVETLSQEEPQTLEGRRQHLFDTYIERMFQRKGKVDRPYTETQVIDWLSWLAQRMVQYSKTVFLVEELQPSWLPTREQLWAYGFSSRMTLGFLAWLIMGLGMFYGSKIIYVDAPINNPILVSPMIGLVTGFVSALVFLIKGDKRKILSDKKARRISEGWSFMRYLMLLALNTSITENTRNDIQPVEMLNWSWEGARRGALMSLFSLLLLFCLCAIFPGFLMWQDNAPRSNVIAWFLTGTIFSIGSFLVFFISFIVIAGLLRGSIGNKTSPNQGITSSIRNALISIIILGLGLGLCIGLVLGLYCWLVDQLIDWKLAVVLWGKGLLGWFGFWLVLCLAIGLFAGLLTGLVFGGMDAMKHYILRLILARKGYAPLDYTRFLDYVAKLIFLRKVGGGYIFIHRTFLEHCAALQRTK